MPQYPFKYLDAYERKDKDFYFGRDEEVKQLYDMTFQSDLLLVYGASGTGKTSLIQCGLANCFETYDWLPLTIRRGANINQSLEKALNDEIGDDDLEYFRDDWKTGNETDNLPLARQIKTLRLKYFKPIYLIFDQFEELYTLDNNKNKDEQEEFYNTVKNILSLNQPVKIIVSMREEYLGYLNDFERIIPDILRKKLRVEPMLLDKVRQVLLGINNPEKSLVTLQKGEEEDLIRAIFDKLNEGKISVELPYLQVLLDKLYRDKTHDDKREPTTPATLSSDDLQQLGNIGDILFDMLKGLVSQLTTKGIDSATVWETLSHFVTEEGTKKPLPATALQKDDHQTLAQILTFFVSKRILRYDEKEQLYEISHDALAKQIHASRPEEEKAKLQVEKMIKDLVNKPENLREPFTEKQLNQIDLYLDKLQFMLEEKEWIEQSRKKIEEEKRAKELELKKKKRQLRVTSFMLALVGLLLFFAGWQWWNAYNAKKNAKKLIDAFYFYDGKFALAYKDYEFYFINKDGEPVEKLHSWKNAEQFEEWTGEAKVVDFDNIEYLLDTLGRYYRYANNINVKEDSIIQILDLFNQNLSALPTEIGKFKNLTKLRLSVCRLDSLPPEIWTLTNLTELNLSYIFGLRTLPPEIGKLKNLTKLCFVTCDIDNLPPEIWTLTNLTELGLSNNRLKTLPADIGKLKNLTKIDLRMPELDSLPPEIWTLTNLTELGLSFNFGLRTLPPEIGKLKNLKVISLMECRLDSLPPEIWTLTNLTTLNLWGNNIKNIPPEIGKLKNLTKLRLKMCRLDNLPPEIWTLTNLTELDLSDNRFKALPAEIGKLKKLIFLNLQGNQITSLPKTINNLKKLKYSSGLYNESLDSISKSFLEQMINKNKKVDIPFAIIEGGTAYKNGLRSAGQILKYGDWEINDEGYLLCDSIINNYRDIEKDVIIYQQDKKISKYELLHFDKGETGMYIDSQVPFLLATSKMILNKFKNDDVIKIKSMPFAYISHIAITYKNKFPYISLYDYTAYNFAIFVATIIAGFIGGIIFHRKNRRLYKWICWGIAGAIGLWVLVAYVYLLLA